MKKEFKLETGTLAVTFPDYPEMVFRELNLRELDMTTKAREFWIKRHPESCHPDKLTFIVSHEYYVEDNPLHVIEATPVLEKIKRLEAALQKCKEQRDLYLCKDTNESEGIFDERIEFNAELESILEGR